DLVDRLADHFLRVTDMKIEWVHPSWRDLVIDHLAGDDGARGWFLRYCSIHGAMLALSVGGGRTGERTLPLLRLDADWAVLADHLHELTPGLEDAELVGLLDAVALALHTVGEPQAHRELVALAAEMLGRLRRIWDARRAPIPLPLLAAWTAAAQRCDG